MTQRTVVPVPVTRVTGDTRVQPHTANLVTSAGSCAISPIRILLSPHVSSSGLTVCEAGRRREFDAIAVAGGEDRRAVLTANQRTPYCQAQIREALFLFWSLPLSLTITRIFSGFLGIKMEILIGQLR